MTFADVCRAAVRPLSTAAGLIVAGIVIVYLLGRWHQAIDAEEGSVNQAAATWLRTMQDQHPKFAQLKAVAAAHADSSRADTAAAVASSAVDAALERALRDVKTPGDSLPIVLVQRDSARAAAVHWRDAFLQMAAARIADSTRADLAEAAATEGERHTRELLQQATSFRVLFFRLPKPPKWLTAAAGCAAGAYLDQDDRARGCGLGAAGLTIAIPTK